MGILGVDPTPFDDADNTPRAVASSART